MAHAEGAPALRVVVVYSPAPGRVDEVALELPAGSTLRDALCASGVIARHAGAERLDGGVWGRRRPPETPLRDGDRVELYRALTVDPKEARRLRYRGQKAPKRR